MLERLVAFYDAESVVTVAGFDFDPYGEHKNMYDVSIFPALKMFAYVAKPQLCAEFRELGPLVEYINAPFVFVAARSSLGYACGVSCPAIAQEGTVIT